MRPAAKLEWCWAVSLLMLMGQAAAAEAPAVEHTQGGQAFLYDAKGHRDPFAPLVKDGRLVGVTQEKASEGLTPVLYGILWDPAGHSMALVNDTEVSVGDSVGSYLVKAIRQDAVVLEREGGEPVVLQLVFEPLAPSSSSTSQGGGKRP